MTELKPCPWCGGDVHIESSDRYPRPECEHVIGYTVVCRNFGCIGYGADDWYKLTEHEAIEAWNTRFEPTCRVAKDSNGFKVWTICSECGHGLWEKSNYCSNCGRRVIEE